MTLNHPHSEVLLAQFATRLQIAHHIPGRVRLKLTKGSAAISTSLIEQAKLFARAVNDVPGIRSVAINILAQSCLVEYDTALIAPSAWPDLVSGTRSPAADSLLEALAAGATFA
ncbi:MAG: hypothetical protein VR70_03030 [Rhodospirillaceae bacterium BRH_c57]|nr:MAG: hypothetical protein VR70_03030 [Rhodospirillaceae bacterium BRH_c57]